MKPSVLVFASYYLPSFRAGGVVRTVANMVERLGEEFNFWVVARDRDLGDVSPFSGVQYDSWMSFGNAQVRYISSSYFDLSQVAKLARTTPHDLIYLNSFFDPRFTQQVLVNHRLGRLAGRPIVLAPRGELSAGALGLKRLKKRVYIEIAKRAKLYEGVIWQASGDLEAADVVREFGRARVVIAPDLVGSSDLMGAPAELVDARDEGGPVRVCFLSRINRIKNLDFALGILAMVKVPVRFSIYGPIEDKAYWGACKRLIVQLPPNIEVIYEGVVVPNEVVATLMQHDVFLFPTRAENFGHVIHEALRAGLPVLISDRTPWQNLAERGVGWDLSLDEMAAFARRIEEVAVWPAAERSRVAARAQAFARLSEGDTEVLKANRRLFLDAIGNGLSPGISETGGTCVRQ